jgi:hypothetical protein
MTALSESEPNAPDILSRVEERGHKVFVNGAYNLNIIGVRVGEYVPDRFCDWLHLVYLDEFGAWRDKRWPITTRPGAHHLRHPMRSDGTAIMEPDQYLGAYVVGLHKGYAALRQDRPVKIRRDNDRDGAANSGLVSVAESSSRINIHAADLDPFDTVDRKRTSIGRWSAGCQVFEDSADYREYWALVLTAASIWGRRFSYTLIEDKS